MAVLFFLWESNPVKIVVLCRGFSALRLRLLSEIAAVSHLQDLYCAQTRKIELRANILASLAWNAE